MGIMNFLMTNKYVGYVAGAILFVLGFKAIKWNERRKGRAEGREQMRERSRKLTHRVRRKIDEKSNDLDERIARRGLRDIASTHRDRRNKRDSVR